MPFWLSSVMVRNELLKATEMTKILIRRNILKVWVLIRVKAGAVYGSKRTAPISFEGANPVLLR